MFDPLIHVVEWALRWPGTPAALALGASAGFWRSARPVAALLAASLSLVPLIISGGTGGRFIAAAAGALFFALLFLSRTRRLEQRFPTRTGWTFCVLVLLCALHSWHSGWTGLSSGTESSLYWVRWWFSWPGLALLFMVAITGLRTVVAPRSPGSGAAVWGPFGLAIVLSGGLLLLEGRSRILEASLLLGMMLGGGMSGLRVFVPGRARALTAALVVVAMIVGWSTVIREDRGAGPYVHPSGLELTDRLQYEIIDDDLELPSGLAHAADGRVFVSDFATNKIWVYSFRSGSWDKSLFALWPTEEALEAEVRSSEAGLWGLAFDSEGGWLYAMGIESWAEQPGPDGRPRGLSRVLRFKDTPGGAPLWEEVVRDLPASNVHSGGALAFGTDGSLFVSVGEGGFGGGGRQDFVGTILRLGRSSTEGESTLKDPQIYGRGLRNPYGLAVGRDGSLFATENGPNCCDRLLRIEEGANFGWKPGQSHQEGDSLMPPGAGVLWDSGPSRIGPTGVLARHDTLFFATWHTVALHEATIGPENELMNHRLRFDGQVARVPDTSAYRFDGGFTGLSMAPDETIWFTALGVLGRVAE